MNRFSTYRATVFLCVALSWPAMGLKAADLVTQYDWLTLGKKSGMLSVEQQGEGSFRVRFEFNDRGRGPKIDESIIVDSDGLIRSHEITGNAYMGAPVAESFTTADGEVRWKSSIEKGSGPGDTDRFWIASNGTPFALAKLASYLLGKPQHTGNAWPSGQLSISKLADKEVTSELGSRTVSLYAITGIGFTPSYVWLDEQNDLFAVAYGWMGLTPSGWNGALSELQTVQDAAEQSYLAELSSQLTQPLPQRTVVTNVDIIDVSGGKTLKDCDIAIQAKVISGIACSPERIAPGEGFVIDGSGLTVMPGLWDMHAHVSLVDGLLNIAAGVTAVRDLANEHDSLMANIELFDSSKVIGPHVRFAGFVDRSGPFAAPTGKLADTVDEAIEFINWYAQHGYGQIKIYSSIDPQWVPAIAAATHRAGMRLGGHIPSFMSAEQAVRDGFDEIQHINFVFLNFLAGPEDDTRTPLRFSLVAQRAHELDLSSDEVSEFVNLLRTSDVTVDTTATIFHSMFLNRAGEIDPSYAMIADHLPVNVRRAFLPAEMDITADNEETYRASAQALLNMIKRLHDGGVQLVAGTDAIAGFTLHRELELYHMAGIPNADILRIATKDAAAVAGAPDAGQVTVGHRADLVFLAENPLENVSAVRKARWVIKGGQLYEPSRIYQAIGIKPFLN